MEGIPDHVFEILTDCWTRAKDDMLANGKLSLGATVMVPASGKPILLPHLWFDEKSKFIILSKIKEIAKEVSPIAVMNIDECFVMKKLVKKGESFEATARATGDLSKNPEAGTALTTLLELRNGRTFTCMNIAVMSPEGKVTGFENPELKLEAPDGKFSGTMSGMCKVE